MFSFLNQLFDENSKKLKFYKPIVEKINNLESQYSSLSDQQLTQKTQEFRAMLKEGKTLEQILPDAYAAVREAVKRTVGQRAYDVQLLAAIALHHQSIAEQRTGEGKTHSVIFPAYLNALTGRGVHIITPNDYLTRVGTGWYPQALHLLDIKTAGIIHEQSFIYDPDYTDPSEKVDYRLSHLKPISRKEAYQADITYGTNNEFGFDYLRDHMVSDYNDMVQKDHYYAVVDEVDFVLIDEARTPLIISSPNNQPVDKYYKFSQIAQQLQPTDYIIDEKAKSATLSEYGIRKVERILNVKNLYEESFETIHYIENAIKAHALFHKDKDYVVKDSQIIIVDEFTGRLMYGRRWSDGLHQAVEAKENVPVQRESQTWATITFQNYFRLYDKLAGMTGTASTEAEEFKKIYNLDVLTIPTHRPISRTDDQDLIFKTKRSKYAAVASKIEELHAKGQPVLIGTTSIENNQIISSLLRKKNIPHQVLNAKNHRSEAEIISKAGVKGAVTVATNMAGRGVDIILGGPSENISKKQWEKLHQEIVDLGGLYVIGTERHESRRIDNQLRGRSGRQGDPGYSQFYVSLEDDLMRIFGGEKISSLMTRFNMPDDVPLTHPLVSRVLEQIQVKVEGYNFDVRKSLVEYDDVINKQRQIIYNIRDNTLNRSHSDPQKNQQEVLDYLSSQIDQIISQNTDPASSNFDADKAVLEFSEIVPLDDQSRSGLITQVSKSKDPHQLLFKIVQDLLKQRLDYFGSELSSSIITFAVISSLDPLWVDHLTALDDLRNGVRLRGYAQKDPLIEYRNEGYQMFKQLLDQFKYNLARKIFRLEPVKQAPQVTVPQNVSEGRGKTTLPQSDIQTPAQPDTNQKPTAVAQKAPGRNDLCPCGSGKKYKKCCYPQFG